MLVPLGRVDKVLAAVREEVLLSGRVEVRVGRIGSAHFPCVDVHPELTLLGERQAKRHGVVLHSVADVLVEALFFVTVAVEGGHEVCERARHAELWADTSSLQGGGTYSPCREDKDNRFSGESRTM